MNHEPESNKCNEKYMTQAVRQDPLPEIPFYDFERVAPPVVTEHMLRRQIEERQARKQAMLVTIAGLVTQLLLLVAMVLLYEYMPGLALIGIGYVMVSLAAGLVTAVVYVERRTTG